MHCHWRVKSKVWVDLRELAGSSEQDGKASGTWNPLWLFSSGTCFLNHPRSSLFYSFLLDLR